jgi:hypothetical protein
MLNRLPHFVFVLSALLLPGMRLAADPVGITSQSAIYDAQQEIVNFTLTFTQAPDFYTLDGDGNPANSFQYRFLGDLSREYPANYASIVTGDELHISDGIAVRNSSPASSDPGSGGWGSLRGLLPFTLDGATLSFSAPFSVLTDFENDGVLNFELDSFNYGTVNDHILGTVTTTPAATPEPSTFALLGGALACVGLTFRNRKRLAHLESGR